MGAHDHKHVHCDHPHLKYCTRCQQQPSWETYTTSPSGCASTGNTVFCNHGDDR